MGDPFVVLMRGLRLRVPAFVDFQALCADAYVVGLGLSLVRRTHLDVQVNGPHVHRPQRALCLEGTQEEHSTMGHETVALIMMAYRVELYAKQRMEEGINEALSTLLREHAQAVIRVMEEDLPEDEDKKDDDDNNNDYAKDARRDNADASKAKKHQQQQQQQQRAAAKTTWDQDNNNNGRTKMVADCLRAFQNVSDMWYAADVPHAVARMVELLKGLHVVMDTNWDGNAKTLHARIATMRERLYAAKGKQQADTLIERTLELRRNVRIRGRLRKARFVHTAMLICWRTAECMQSEISKIESEIRCLETMLRGKGASKDDSQQHAMISTTTTWLPRSAEGDLEQQPPGPHAPSLTATEEAFANGFFVQSLECSHMEED